MIATINYGEIEIEVEVEFESATAITPYGRIDWKETEYPSVSSIMVEDGKGREWEIYDKVDEDTIAKLEADCLQDSAEARAEAKYEQMMDRDNY